MPYVSEFVDGGRGIVHTGSGTLTGEEMIAGALRVRAEVERTRLLEYGLADLSAVDELRVTPEDLRRLADEQLVTARLVPNTVAAVVATKDHIYGMARMWEAFADPTRWVTRVFRERAMAESWLRDQVAARRTESGAGRRDR